MVRYFGMRSKSAPDPGRKTDNTPANAKKKRNSSVIAGESDANHHNNNADSVGIDERGGFVELEAFNPACLI